MARILLADDQPDQAALRKCLLEGVGHDVRVAQDPPAALREMELAPADLVIMDLRFPNAAGIPDHRLGMALIRSMRKSHPDTPVLVLSGWPDELYGSPEEKMVSAILVKPVSIAALQKAITEMVC